MIYVLIDFFLIKDSPFYKNDNRVEMGNNMVTPKFAPLISIVSTMVTRCFTQTWKESDLITGTKPYTYEVGKVIIF